MPEQLTTPVVLTLFGAVFAVLLGRWIQLYQFSDPQVWVAALIGGALALIAYGGPVAPSVADRAGVPHRVEGSLSFSRSST